MAAEAGRVGGASDSFMGSKRETNTSTLSFTHTHTHTHTMHTELDPAIQLAVPCVAAPRPGWKQGNPVRWKMRVAVATPPFHTVYSFVPF
jgi:hypothetical protein